MEKILLDLIFILVGSSPFYSKDKDMATYIIQRCYSVLDDDNKGGMSTGAKVAIGLGAAAATFAGARRGMLGNRAMMKTNQMWGNLGAKFGSQGMIKSASSKIGTATYNSALGKGLSKQTALDLGKAQRASALGTWTSGGQMTGVAKSATNAIKAEVGKPTFGSVMKSIGNGTKKAVIGVTAGTAALGTAGWVALNKDSN